MLNFEPKYNIQTVIKLDINGFNHFPINYSILFAEK